MKAAGPHLVFLFMAGTLGAQDSGASLEATAKTSTRLRQEITTFLPKYTPPPPPPAIPTANIPTESDPNVLTLPKFTVKEYRPRDHDPDVWLTDKAMKQKAMVAYKQSMSEFEWALNSWFIPFVTPPASVRARHAYRSNKFREEITRLNDLVDRIAAEDPQAAAGLKKELRNLVEGRPPGGK